MKEVHTRIGRVIIGLKEKRRGIVGDGLLSHRVTPALPSTLVALTAGFEMEPGVPPPLLPPTITLLLFNCYA